MAWTVTTVSLVVFGTALVAAAVGIASLRERPDPMAWPLAAMMFAVTAWAVPHAISFGYGSVQEVAFWTRLLYPGAVTAPVLYLVVALRYAGHDRWLSRRTFAVLGLTPVVTVAAVWTNPAHGLVWESLSVVTVHDATVLVPEYGPWYWVNLGYLYLVTIVGLLVLSSVAVRSESLYRQQATLMFVGGLLPLAANVAFTFGAGGSRSIDLTTTALALSGLTFALALFHFDLLEVRPVARARLLEGLDDGVVVVGPKGHLVDFNATAERVLEGLSVGEPADRVFPSGLPDEGGELVIQIDGDRRVYRTQLTPLTDDHGRSVGRLVHLDDVTAVVEREQRIGVLNRILRHNVRNELNIVSGHLDLLAQRASPESREHIEKAERSAERVVEFAEKARDIERTLGEDDAPVVVSVQPMVDRAVEAARDRFPGAVIEADLENDGRRVRVADERLYEQSLRELVENAIIHNDRDPPRVVVRIGTDRGHVRVSVADNGPGIPVHERDLDPIRIETELDHGSGLGLWLVRWTAWLSSGEVTFTENEPRGSVVTLAVPSGHETESAVHPAP